MSATCRHTPRRVLLHDRPGAQPEGHHAWRWNIETTFQELHYHLGLETTREWCRRTVLRAAPLLFGL
jgi:hypothetical protein